MSFESPVERVPLERVGGEREQLAKRLDFCRATILSKLSGLSDEDLRRVMVPTGLSCLGVVKHLAEVEHTWFAQRLAKLDEPYLYFSEEDEEADMRVEPGETTEEIVNAFLSHWQRSNEIVAGYELDDTFQSTRPEPISVRFLYLHLIAEYARHAGHLDIFRETIDGVTGE